LLKKDPGAYDNDYSNLKGYVMELDLKEEEKQAKLSFALE